MALLLSPIPGNFLVDHCPARFRFPETAWLEDRWHEIDTHNAVLLLGSSRTGSYIQNRDLVKTTRELTGDHSVHIFNAAIAAEEPVTMKFVTNKLLEAGKSPPRLVIIETNPDFLSWNNEFFPFFINRQLVTSDLPGGMHDIIFSNRGKNIGKLASSRLMPFYKFRGILLDWAGSFFNPPANTVAPQHQKDAGYTVISVFDEANYLGTQNTSSPAASAAPFADEPSAVSKPSPAVSSQAESIITALPPSIAFLSKEPPEARAARLARDVASRKRELRNYKPDGFTVAAFEQTISTLRKQGTTVILVRTPLASQFRTLLTQEIDSAYMASIRRFQSLYGCEFVDLSSRIPDDHFIDLHHGNQVGREEFTRILAREVVAPAWMKIQSADNHQ